MSRNPKKLEKMLLEGEISIAEKAKGLLAHMATTFEALAVEDKEASELIDEETRAWFDLLRTNTQEAIKNLEATQGAIRMVLKKYQSAK